MLHTLPALLRRTLAPLLVGVFATSGAAQDADVEPLVPDRPGIGDGAHAVAARALQVEAGATYARSGSRDVYSLGQAVLRYGLGAVEARVGLNSFVVQRGADDFEGFEDVALGAKVPLPGRPADALRISGLATLTVPTGSARLTADDPTVTATALADLALTPRLSVSANAAWATPLYTGDGSWMLTVTPTLSLPAAIGVYAGWAGFGGDGSVESVLEGGVTALLGSDSQLDLNSGWTPETGDSFVGVGLARRWR